MLIARVLPDTATLASELRGHGRKHRRDRGSAVGNLVRERAEEYRA